MIPQSLYVHIPFCRHICAYCDFAKVFYRPGWADAYLQALKKELIWRQSDRPFQTVYIGGGSPSALNERQLETLLRMLSKPLSQCTEATFEVNPEDMNEDKAFLLRQYGINRVSIGVQTFDSALLTRLGRNHQITDVENCVRMLQAVGIHNISFDLIYGLPGQSMNLLKQDLRYLASFDNVRHVSFYSLILEPHTRFALEHVRLQSDEWLLEAQKIIQETLAERGFQRYEVSNYAKDGFYSQHNLVYWHNEHYIGLGVGASGYIENLRYDNTKSLQIYLRDVSTAKVYPLNQAEQMFETLMVGLRLCEGVSLSAFKSRFGCTLWHVYGERLTPYLSSGYLKIENDHLKTSEKGMNILDEILIHLMD